MMAPLTCDIFSFMAQTESEMMAWIEALNKAVAAALTDLKSSGSTAKELIQRIYEEPSNAYCADCNAPGKTWQLQIQNDFTHDYEDNFLIVFSWSK